MRAPQRNSGARLAAILLPLLSAIFACGGGGRENGIAEPLWLWRDHDLRHVEVASFYVVRDLILAQPSGRAVVRIAADETYVLFLNEHRIGSGRRSARGAGDEYDVTEVLRPGVNRVIVEMRSSTGAGGLWLELRDATGRLAGTDGSWSVVDTEWRGLFRGTSFPAGSPVRVLGRGPQGRWGSIESFVSRPPFESTLLDAEPVEATGWRPWRSAQGWEPMPPRRRRSANLGPLVEIDFGEVRTGYLQLAYRSTEEGRPAPALVVFGVEPIGDPPVDADLVLRPIAERNLFQEALPRRFRYAAVAGLPGLFAAEVLTVREASLAALPVPEGVDSTVGVFGVRPPPRLGSPVEHEIWRELERATGLALRKPR